MSKQLSDSEKNQWTAIAVMTSQQVDFMFSNFHELSWKAFMITGYVHWAAMEELMSDEEEVVHFTVSDCGKALKRRWPNHRWTWKFVSKTFQTLIDDGKLKRQKKQNGSREVLFRVTDKYKDDCKIYYRTMTKTADFLLATQGYRNAKTRRNNARKDFESQWNNVESAHQLCSFVNHGTRVTRDDIFNFRALFSAEKSDK
jgi:hypothetical protein